MQETLNFMCACRLTTFNISTKFSNRPAFKNGRKTRADRNNRYSYHSEKCSCRFSSEHDGNECSSLKDVIWTTLTQREETVLCERCRNNANVYLWNTETFQTLRTAERISLRHMFCSVSFDCPLLWIPYLRTMQPELFDPKHSMLLIMLDEISMDSCADTYQSMTSFKIGWIDSRAFRSALLHFLCSEHEFFPSWPILRNENLSECRIFCGVCQLSMNIFVFFQNPELLLWTRKMPFWQSLQKLGQ